MDMNNVNIEEIVKQVLSGMTGNAPAAASAPAASTGIPKTARVAAFTASVTADTSPSTIIVTSRPPSLRSHDASSTSAVLHMMSSASIAATTPVISINPYDLLMSELLFYTSQSAGQMLGRIFSTSV